MMELELDNRPPLSVVSTRVHNPCGFAITFVLEPWGERYRMPAGAVFEVRGRGPAGDTLEVRWSDEGVIVYGWPGSVVQVLCDGVDVAALRGIGRFDRNPAPRLPRGMRTSQWVAELAAAP